VGFRPLVCFDIPKNYDTTVSKVKYTLVLLKIQTKQSYSPASLEALCAAFACWRYALGTSPAKWR
jgi:hypothetical protein